MEKKCIDFSDYSLAYPVGGNMESAIQFSKRVLNVVKDIQFLIRPQGFKELNIFCRGSSGSILASLFTAFAPWACNVVYVKKLNEQAHSGRISNFDKTLPSLIIDDFVSSGETIREIYKAIVQRTGNPVYNINILAISYGYRPDCLGFIPDFLIERKS